MVWFMGIGSLVILIFVIMIIDRLDNKGRREGVEEAERWYTKLKEKDHE